MEYKDFVYKEDAFEGFITLRKALNDLLENPKNGKNFEDVFAEVGSLALSGNPIAQDLMSYYYKTGIKDVIPENYDQYMKWAILAGANGNEFAIEKLQFFLNYAFTEIVSSDNLEKIISKNGLTQQNYLYVLGNLLCEALVDALGISANKLVAEKPMVVKYTPEKLRTYKRELEKALPRVMDYLLA